VQKVLLTFSLSAAAAVVRIEQPQVSVEVEVEQVDTCTPQMFTYLPPRIR